MKEPKNVISFLNMKGGVCKTTLCKEMAMEFSKKGEKILVIDIDPQANCTQSFFEKFKIIKEDELEDEECLEMNENSDKVKKSEQKDEEDEEDKELPSIENIFGKSPMKSNLDKIILKLDDNLHLIPGDLRTVFMERETSTGAAEQKLLNFIEENELKFKYKYIFIDCPPTYSFYTVSAILASDFYYVPVKPDVYSTLGLDLLDEVINKMRQSYRANFKNKPIINLGVIFTLIPNRNNSRLLKNARAIKRIYSKKFNTYFWKENFMKVDSVATAKLSTFICDRKNESLKNNLEKICKEFDIRVGVLNDSDNNS